MASSKKVEPIRRQPSRRHPIRRLDEGLRWEFHRPKGAARAKVSAVPRREWPGLLRRVAIQAARDRITTIAGSLAFHGFLALLPLVIAAVALLPIVRLPASDLHTLLHDTSVVLPAQMSQIVNEAISHPPKRGRGITEAGIALAVALWSSIEAMSTLQIALDVAYEVPRDRSFFAKRLTAFPLLAFSLVLGGAASVLIVLGEPLESLLPRSAGIARPGFGAIVLAVRYGGALVLLVVLLSLFYRFGTAASRGRFEWVSPGSAVAAIGSVVVTAGFSFYLGHFGHEARSYGALAGAVVTLLWMFITSVVVLFGAELNRELERFREASPHSAPPSVPR